MRIFYTATALLALGCGGTTKPEQIEETPLLQASAPPTDQVESSDVTTMPDSDTVSVQPSSPTTAKNEIHRDALNQFLERGPSAILALVQTEPHRIGGKFIGFEIVNIKTAIPPPIDLRVGDVVLAINGLKIVMPDDYFRVFNELKVVSEIRFTLLRSGETIEKIYHVIDP